MHLNKYRYTHETCCFCFFILFFLFKWLLCRICLFSLFLFIFFFSAFKTIYVSTKRKKDGHSAISQNLLLFILLLFLFLSFFAQSCCIKITKRIVCRTCTNNFIVVLESNHRNAVKEVHFYARLSLHFAPNSQKFCF